MKKILTLFATIFVLFVLITNSAYILDQRQYALILQFGEPVATTLKPGLNFMIPFIQQRKFFDNRIQNISFSSGDSSEVVASDQKTMRMDAFAKYRIVDPKQFYQAVQNERSLKIRMGSVIESTIREVVGSVSFSDILGDKRTAIMTRIVTEVNRQMQAFGVDILDVRITRVSLPEKARNAVYERMRTDREKEAKDIRARGSEESQIIKANADKEKVTILAEARKQADITKGEGDAEVIKIFAGIYNQDPEFFSFYRSLQAYRTSLGNGDTTLILSSDNQFLTYMNGK